MNKHYKKNFQTLILAAKNDDLCLVECTDKESGKTVMTICAAMTDEEGNVTLSPFAKMFDGNPYEELNPPAHGEEQ